MLSGRIVIKRNGKDEAEKPFWISFADLMSALMVLFLLVMSVALMAVTKTVSEAEQAKLAREQNIAALLKKISQAAARYPGISVDLDRHVIDFGDRARFDTASHKLSQNQARLLRAFVPEILNIARDELGRKWLKRIVVEGFSDQRGTYLFNLNLSMQRSQRVLCVLLAPPLQNEPAMRQDELEQIRELFLVGGYSFNSAKASFNESRRIELRLEFLDLGEALSSANSVVQGDFGLCSLDH
jgi:outer membrane protein OmpA-like peptidoglycan-associated protein